MISPDKIIVFACSITGIFFTYWFFLMRKDTDAVVANEQIAITVQGGYTPEVIALPKGKTKTLTFLRKDPSSCLEEVVLPDFKIRKFLPLNKPISISITPQKEGTYEISCGMNMFHGKIVVK